MWSGHTGAAVLDLIVHPERWALDVVREGCMERVDVVMEGGWMRARRPR